MLLSSQESQLSKVIFLDFDGVLLTDSAAQQQTNQGVTMQTYLQKVEFDRDCVSNLNQLVDRTGAQLVLSTSWAEGNSFSSVANCLMRNGIDPGHIWEYDDPSEHSWMTPRSSTDNRALQIAEWLKLHPEVNTWCAIDDRSEIAQLGPAAVITDPQRGLDSAALKKALSLLS